MLELPIPARYDICRQISHLRIYLCQISIYSFMRIIMSILCSFFASYRKQSKNLQTNLGEKAQLSSTCLFFGKTEVPVNVCSMTLNLICSPGSMNMSWCWPSSRGYSQTHTLSRSSYLDRYVDS